MNDEPNDVSRPCIEFDWQVYDDATYAGLSMLIPIPLVDWVFEQFFRRRMPGAIARHRGRQLSPGVAEELNRSADGCRDTCLFLPLLILRELIKRLFQKLLYFLAIKAATDSLSHYWHRAFLIDCMLLEGHLTDRESAAIARRAMDRTLEETETSPLLGLARNVVSSTRHVLRTLRRARRREEDEEIAHKRSLIRRNWDEFQNYLVDLAARYDAHYEALQSAEEV